MHNPWLSPRAYIIGMSGLQLRALMQADRRKMQRQYGEYVEALARANPPTPKP